MESERDLLGKIVALPLTEEDDGLGGGVEDLSFPPPPSSPGRLSMSVINYPVGVSLVFPLLGSLSSGRSGVIWLLN